MQLVIKLIQVGSEYKALLLDMSKKGNRLVYIASNTDRDAAWNDAESHKEALEASQVEDVSQWH